MIIVVKKKRDETLFVKRADGRLEWQCKHGVGHTIKVPFCYEKQKAWWVHGCDWCCSKKEFKRLFKKLNNNETVKGRVIRELYSI